MTLLSLIRRNCKLFFKDKAMFLTSLITPMILLILYVTFLGTVYREAFEGAMPKGMTLPEKLTGGFVGGQLLSSLLAVSCVTVSFSSNLLMVQDKVTGARKDLTISPVRKSTLAMSYPLASLISSMMIAIVALGISLLYLGKVGWYMTFSDILWMLADVLLLVMFGIALSSVINFFLSSQGQMSAVGTIVSSCYGFICGAYMPISNYGKGLQNILAFSPGTYGTSLIRNHTMGGVLDEMNAMQISEDVITALRDSIDCNVYFFDKSVPLSAMYGVLIGTTLILTAVYIGLCRFHKKNNQN